mmetsp:Transcript_8729/g.9714  ORF Transcript_8729/g.9714 Transcript_8729/m.9714 type:complete len:175 (-) Transcript_8729:44-568(-)
MADFSSTMKELGVNGMDWLFNGPELCKDKGNEFFAKKQYSEAVKWYTTGLEASESCNPNSSVKAALLSNRSGCYAILKRYQEAEADADDALKEKPMWYKAHIRKAKALLLQQKIKESYKEYQNAVLTIDETTKSYLELRKTMEGMKQKYPKELKDVDPLKKLTTDHGSYYMVPQ